MDRFLTHAAYGVLIIFTSFLIGGLIIGFVLYPVSTGIACGLTALALLVGASIAKVLDHLGKC